MSKVKKEVLTAICIALCVVLPMAFHMIPNAGNIFCPMHIPVLLCGLICGWKSGLICGLTGPLLSSVLTGMPPAANLPWMLAELAVYGLVSGLMMAYVRRGGAKGGADKRSRYGQIYICLIAAMLCGRVVSGLMKALIFTGGYSLNVWLTATFVTALPALIIQLLFIPYIVVTLEKARLI